MQRSVLPLAAALCTWVFLVKRIVIHWTIHWLKLGAAAGPLPALILVADLVDHTPSLQVTDGGPSIR